MLRVFPSITILVLIAAPAFASFAEIPLEILVDEADTIVAGKVTKVQDGSFAIGARKYDVAVLEVTEMLKSTNGKLMEVLIGQPGAGLVTSADIRFRAGQQGIWLLTKDPERNVYWAKHPSQFQRAKERKKLADLVEARSKVAGGKAVNGLVARVELLENAGGFQVCFSLKNVSEKSITICDYVGNRPLQVQWIGPDGNMRKSSHYAWLARADLAGLTKADFITLPPGSVRFIGPRGDYSSILFQTQPAPEINLVGAGQHRVTVSYASNEDGKQFALNNVWTGTVAANEVTFTVP